MSDKAAKAGGVCGLLKNIFDPESRRKAALEKYQENYRKSMAEQHQYAYQVSQQAGGTSGIATPYTSNPALDTIKEDSSSHSKARSAHNGSHHRKNALVESRSSLLASST